jgi:hypothetical protein
MARKKKEETLSEVLEQMADECKAVGQNNLAIVLYSYLGAEKIGMDGFFAKHCQDFVKDGVKEIEKIKKRHRN